MNPYFQILASIANEAGAEVIGFGEDSNADVVSMVTRIPVRKVAQSEGQLLLKMQNFVSLMIKIIPV